jgi:hypothetical protein
MVQEERTPQAMLLNVNPEFDSLRGDPRFATAVKRITEQ